MNIKSTLQEQIRLKYQLGYSAYQTFTELAIQSGSDPIDEWTFNEWLQYFHSGKNGASVQLNQIKENQYFFFTEVVKNYWICEKSIFVDFKQSLSTYKLLPVNVRYAFKCKQMDGRGKFVGLEMMDLFHGQTRELSLINPQMIQGFYNIAFRTYPLDYNLLLAHEYPIRVGSSSSTLYLLSIDYTTWTCKIVDQLELDLTFKSFVFDEEMISEKFVLIHVNAQNEDGVLVANTVSIQNQRFILDQKQHVIRVEDSFCLNLSNNTLSGLQLLYGENAYVLNGIAYWEVDLLDDGRISKSFTFDIDKSIDMRKLNANTFSWTQNKCYLAPKILNGPSTIFVFDVDEKRCAVKSINCTNIYEICIDEDGIMALLTENAAYRFALRQPENLNNLNWFKIRRQSLFQGSPLYAKMMDQLPLKFRPFSF